MTKELFQHELCTDFQNVYTMSKAEAQNFHEAFAHFHTVMTDINNETLLNALWLQENFFRLHNELEAKDMLRAVIKQSTIRQAEIKNYTKNHVKETK